MYEVRENKMLSACFKDTPEFTSKGLGRFTKCVWLLELLQQYDKSLVKYATDQ